MIEVKLPSSKSISLRGLVLNFLNKNKTDISYCSDCDDAVYLQKALTFSEEKIFVGESGAAARFMAALSLVHDTPFVLHGSKRLHERPMKDLFDVLEYLGVEIQYLEKKNFLPARFVPPKKISQTSVQIFGETSSQFISGLALVAPSFPNEFTIEIQGELISRPYIEMTIDILRQWGVKLSVSKNLENIRIQPGFHPPQKFSIPVDCTAMSYPVAYSLLTRKPIKLIPFTTPTFQGDEAFLQIAQQFGARVIYSPQTVEIHPPTVLNSPGTFDFSCMPDVAMTAMMIAACTQGQIKCTGLQTLPHKESDRIQAMKEGFDTLGIVSEQETDWIAIQGKNPSNISKSKQFICSHNDHRIAMVFGVLKKSLNLDLEISNSECVSKSWKNFWIELSDWAGELRPVAATILRNKNLYLIVKKPRNNHAWQFPQGGVEDGESFFQAAQRELLEECGDMKVQFNKYPVGEYKYFFPSDFSCEKSIRGARVLFFKAAFEKGTVHIDTQELENFAWVEKEKLPQYFDSPYWEKVKNFF
jgi:3-phosphoshikimate 1-carboxyvinyltransferase